MPEGESFWNPYRWVTVSNQSVKHDDPHYHHVFSGLSGRLRCELEALTPLFVGDGKGEFARHTRNRQPYIPATSLKGAIRSLAEVVGNASTPFSSASAAGRHRRSEARSGSPLDVAARTFGYLHGGDGFAGLIRFSDAEIIGCPSSPSQWPQYEVAVGQPKKAHGAFYPDRNRRKFYHHHVGARTLVPIPPNIKPKKPKLRPAPSGTRFAFTVGFENLRDEEIDLLLYCLALEEQASVELGPAALGRSGEGEGKTLRGPMRHKLGGAKPHGAGSVHIRILTMELWESASRYRGTVGVEIREAECLANELERRTATFRERRDRTMQELRAMLIYDLDDPRGPFQYPTFQWFHANPRTPLKPTI